MFTVWCGMLHHRQKRCRLRSACGAQVPELLFLLKSLKFCHWWFKLSIISLKWLSYLSYFAPFFFLKVCQIPKPEYPQSVQLFSQVECCLEKQENKTKWITYKLKKKAMKTQTKTNNKNPTSSTYNSNSCRKLCLEVTTLLWHAGERVLCVSYFTFHPKEY